jgi:hypothetical protein
MVGPDLVENYLISLNLKRNVGLKPPVKRPLKVGVSLWICFKEGFGGIFIHNLPSACA